MVGKTASKLIAEKVKYNFDDFLEIMDNNNASYFICIDGIGNSIINSLDNYFANHYIEITSLASGFKFEIPVIKTNNSLKEKIFVITGSVKHYSNREALKSDIKAHGGKVAESISSKTDYLINNDINSTSSKNQKAKSLGIPIISEEEFLSMISK